MTPKIEIKSKPSELQDFEVSVKIGTSTYNFTASAKTEKEAYEHICKDLAEALKVFQSAADGIK